MTVTHARDRVSQQTADRTGTTVRLRVDVYDAIAKPLGLLEVTMQAKRHGIHRATMTRIRAGGEPTLDNAFRIAEDFGAPIEALFERIKAA